MTTNSGDEQWWKNGVIYQIYPRSFFDANHDGVGDLSGITEKLDYLSDLGIDGIWLSPVNQSPMYDFGYDISDYRRIDSIFGNTADFNRLLREAHERKIRVIMDLVINHTSHLHPWFKDSRASRDNPKRDWYIWHDGRNGRPPNNWKAAFGGNAWEWDKKTDQFYLHSFLKEQPDLNWRNPELRRAVFKEITYWLDMGVDGFRIDVVNFFIKDERLRDNPFTIGPTPRPYDLQKHIYDRNRPETLGLVKELRKLTDRYDDRMLVGEVYSPPPGDPDLSAAYLGNGKDALHLSFDFSLLYGKFAAHHFREKIKRWYSRIPEKGWPCLVLSNHDQPRSFNRYRPVRDALPRARLLAAMLLTLRGTPFIYYGEEIGMSGGKIKRADIQDPLGKKYWPLHKGRDNARTPMQWSGEKFAGFSKNRPWLPVNPDYDKTNVSVQIKDPASLLNFYIDLIALRRKKTALQTGSWTPIHADPHVVAYYRSREDKRISVWLNFARTHRFVSIPDYNRWRVVLATHQRVGDTFTGFDFQMNPHEVLILEKIDL